MEHLRNVDVEISVKAREVLGGRIMMFDCDSVRPKKPRHGSLGVSVLNVVINDGVPA